MIHPKLVLKKKSYRGAGAIVFLLACVVAVSFFTTPPTSACGPFFTDAIFVFTKHPDFPLETFAAGKLGVVSPSWARSYLVAAYRNLSGAPLSEAEAKGIKALWDARLNLGYDSSSEDWVKKWTEARKKVPGAPAAAEVNAYRNREKPHEYESFLNCQQDAFTSAETVLNERIARFGADSLQVRSWLTAQDTVFLNCGEGRHIPAEASTEAPDLPPLLRADRAYQIAAANFYSTNFDEAMRLFDAIAKDKDSPYRETAAYVAARAMLRKGSLAEDKEIAAASLSDAENRLSAILKDSSLSRVHAAAARLLSLTRLRLHPETKLHEIAHTIVKRDSSKDFRQDVWDYTVLMDKFLGEDSGDDESTQTPVPASLRSDDLSDWIVTLEDGSKEAAAHALQRFEQSNSLPWLVAAISKSNGQAGAASTNMLLSKARAVGTDSPAFATLAYHSARLLIETGRPDEARALLDKVLTNDRPALDASATNSLMGQRMLLAQNLEQFLQFAQRKPAAFSDDNDGRQIPGEESEYGELTKGSKLFFDLDTANIFNQAMPVSVTAEAARSNTLATNLRRDLTQAAFVRAALLDQREAANQAATMLPEFYPELKEFLVPYQRAATPEARRFAAVFLALKFPGLRPYVSAGIGRTSAVSEIDSYRDNYWCAEAPVPPGGAPSEDTEATKRKPVPVPQFLKASQTVAAREFAALQALGTAPNYFARLAIEWTEKNPNDPRSPEALHLAVRSTRYGCTDKDTGRWSKAAFDLLHRKYPNTTWARNTKYWFKG